MERKGAVTFKGTPLTLAGREVTVGTKAPDFTALDVNLSPVSLSDFSGRTTVISSTPSLDTPICDSQARRFNEEAVALPGSVVINISMDLPFAIKRFCTVAGITGLIALSDHRDASFGLAYGMLIKELRLLARGVFVIDPDGTVRYREIVSEVTEPVDFDAALAAVREVSGA